MSEDKISMGDFTGAIGALAEEKGIGKEQVHSTVEAAIAAAYKKEYGKRGQNVRAEMDAISGAMKFFLVKEVVDETTREFVEESEDEDDDASESSKKDVQKKDEKEGSQAKEEAQDDEVDGDEEEKKQRYNEERDILIEEAKKRDKDIAIGDTIEESLPTETEFGRVAAQTAKQVIIQRIREVERDAMYKEYKEKEGEIVNGTVQRIEGRTVFVDLGKSVAVLFPREQVRGEHYSIGQRIKVYIESVELDTRGPGIKLSRTHAEMVRSLFEMEVPEIYSGVVELKAVAREAGSRSKIAVWTDDEDIDPVGSCVGQKGMRVNTVIDALGGEKIDIIEWNEKTEDFIAAALSPASVVSVEVNEETKHARVMVPDDQLSLAIGKHGQNVRLAVKMTGWNLDVESAQSLVEKEAKKKDLASADEVQDKKDTEIKKEEKEGDKENDQEAVEEKEVSKAKKSEADDLTKIEGIGPKIAQTLIAAGVTTFTDLAGAESSDLSEKIKDVRGAHDPTTWPQQADLAAKDKWDELKELQDKLDGGKA